LFRFYAALRFFAKIRVIGAFEPMTSA